MRLADNESMRRTLLLIGIATLSGCAENPFRQYYVDRTGGADITKSDRIVLADAPPEIIGGSNLDEDAQRMLENGYVLLGFSSFFGPSGQEAKVREQAASLHAAVAIIYSNYKDTLSGSMPLTTPATQTSYTNAQATAYGSRGTVNAYGTATTTTYGSSTTYVPYTVDRSNYFASYWVKQNIATLKLGCHISDLTSEQRRTIASNKGVQVVSVIKGTPAYRADILKGDIIRSIGGDQVFDSAAFHEITKKDAGQTVDVELLRDGKPITKTIKLN